MDVRGDKLFLRTNYVLGNELVEKMNINIGNLSSAKKDLEEVDNYSAIIKLGNCLFVDKNSPHLPNNIQEGLKKYEFTDMTDKLPLSYINEQWGVNRSTVENLIDTREEFKEINVLADKAFVVFDQKFSTDLYSTNVSVLSKKEKEECEEENLIDGSLQLTVNKYLGWYNV